MREKRAYLSQRAHEFELICRAGISGSYDHPVFDGKSQTPQESEPNTGTGGSDRLRAEITLLKEEFARVMEHFGHFWCSDNSEMSCAKIPNGTKMVDQFRSPLIVDQVDIVQYARESLEAYKTGVPSQFFNPHAIGNLFRRASTPWDAIAQSFVTMAWSKCQKFMEQVIRCTMDPECGNAIISQLLQPVMLQKKAAVLHKFEELRKSYSSPYATTYNPALSRRIRQCTLTRWSDPVEYEEPISVEDNVLQHMWQFYEITLRTFIDNVANIVIENGLLEGLTDMFNSPAVLDMSDDVVDVLVPESDEIRLQRATLEPKLERLEAALQPGQRRQMSKPNQQTSLQHQFRRR